MGRRTNDEDEVGGGADFVVALDGVGGGGDGHCCGGIVYAVNT